MTLTRRSALSGLVGGLAASACAPSRRDARFGIELDPDWVGKAEVISSAV